MVPLRADLEMSLPLIWGRKIQTIFIGGGTPSLMTPETVGTLLDAVAAHWKVPANIEVTMEANPQSADANRFAGYRAAGVNRLSLGVQALNDADLKFLGRLHDADEARAERLTVDHGAEAAGVDKQVRRQLLEGADGGVEDAGVEVPAFLSGEQACAAPGVEVPEGGGGIDRNGVCSGLRVDVVSGVNGAGTEA